MIGESKLYLVIQGDPIPKARPRVTKNGTYTPTRTKNAQEAITLLARHQWKKNKPFEGPLEMELAFYFAMPKSWSKEKRKAMRHRPCMKIPDIDNLEKLVMDGLNKSGVWEDDKQVARVHSEKVWGEHSQTFIEVREI